MPNTALAGEPARPSDAQIHRGTIVFFSHTKGYGFVQPSAGGPDVYLHALATDPEDVAVLHEGLKVEYEVGRGRDGRPRAERVRIA